MHTQLADDVAYRAKVAAAKAENRVVVIKFYASWCRGCKAMAPKYNSVAEEWPAIEFCEVLFDNNKKLCNELQIKTLPFVEASERPVEAAARPIKPAQCRRRLKPGRPRAAMATARPVPGPPLCPRRVSSRGHARLLAQIYAGLAGKVEGFSCGPSKIHQLIERLEVHGGCVGGIPCTSVAGQLEGV